MPELEGCIAVLAGREADDGKAIRQILGDISDDRVVLAGFYSEMDGIWINTVSSVYRARMMDLNLPFIEG